MEGSSARVCAGLNRAGAVGVSGRVLGRGLTSRDVSISEHRAAQAHPPHGRGGVSGHRASHWRAVPLT